MTSQRNLVAAAALIALCSLAATLSARPAATAAPQPPAAPTATPEPALSTLIGKPAPDFRLPDQNDKMVSLAEQKGKWVVLAFYPKDMTRGCTLQNISYSKNFDRFAPLNAVVYTVSTQDSASKRQFCEKESLHNSLLSDTDGKVAAAYQVLNDASKLARRVTFYIAPDGTVAAVDSKIQVQTAAEDSLATLATLTKNASPSVPTLPAQSAEIKTQTLTGPADSKVALGKEVYDFGLPNVATGRTNAFTSLKAGKKAAVIAFISTQCPVSNAYNERLNQLAAEYGKKGVQFIAINSNSGETTDAVAAHARANDFGFPVLKDQGNQLADRFEAAVTPEVYVTDSKGILIYHGAIDDSINVSEVKKRYLVDALEAQLAGKPIAVKNTRASGCSIKRVKTEEQAK